MRNLLLAAALTLAAWVQPAPPSYVFSYFVGNGEDGLHLLSSRDGLQWTPLNGGRSFLYPAVGSRLMRDPSITRGPDGTFHLVWTTGWWDTGIGIAHSKNLVEWSEQKFLPVMDDMPGAQNCWAPEIFFDQDNGRYLIFWATTTVREPDTSHRIYYVETRDFKAYTKAKLLYDGGFSVIDAFIVKAAPGRFVMVMKDETALPAPKKNLRVAEAARADGPYGAASAPISADWVEGPSVLKRGRDWLIYYDEYTRRKYGALQSTDLAHWTLVKDLAFPRGVRHGTAFEVSADVAARLAEHSTESAAERWRQTPAGIEWPPNRSRPGPKPHDDHIEMSGLRVSSIVAVRRGPRRPPDDLAARRVADAADDPEQHRREPAAGLRADGPASLADRRRVVTEERLQSSAIDGTLTLRTLACGTPCKDGAGALGLVRTVFPSRDKDAIVETIEVTNLTRRPLAVTSAARGVVVHTDAAKGVDGDYVIEAAADRVVNWTLQPDESRSYAVVYSARRVADPAVTIDAPRELAGPPRVDGREQPPRDSRDARPAPRQGVRVREGARHREHLRHQGGPDARARRRPLLRRHLGQRPGGIRQSVFRLPGRGQSARLGVECVPAFRAVHEPRVHRHPQLDHRRGDGHLERREGPRRPGDDRLRRGALRARVR